MKIGKRQNTFFLFVCVPLILALVSCQESKFDDEFLPGYNNDSASTTKSVGWDFSSSSDYSCESGSCASGENIIVSSGKATLQNVDTEHTGNDFSSGSHVGSEVSNSKISMLTQPSTSSTHVNTILPSHSSSLAGYWRFDGDFTDDSGNHNDATQAVGTTGFSTDSAVEGQSADFDSTSSLNVTHSSSISLSGNYATSFWVKLNTFGEDIGGGDLYSRVFRKGAHYQIFFVDLASSDPSIRFVGSGNFTYTSSLLSSNIGNWTHIAVTYDGSNSYLYINGDLVHSAAGGALGSSNADDLAIGNYNNSGTNRRLDGKLDELAIWDDSLSSSEVKSIYLAQSSKFAELRPDWTPHYSDLVGYWKMDGNWQDSSGKGNTGVPSGHATATFTTNGVVGTQGGSLDGSNDYLLVSHSSELDLTSSWSIGAWVKPTSVSSTMSIVEKYNWVAGLGGYGLRLSSGEVHGFIATNASTAIECRATNSINANSWAYVSVSYNHTSNTMNCFVNGALVNSTNAVVLPLSSNTTLKIGARGDTPSTHYFSGDIDDIAIWNRSLSSGEFSRIYNRQKQKHAASYESPVIDLGKTQGIESLIPSTELPFGKEISKFSESSSGYSSLNASSDLSNGLVAHWGLNELAWSGSAEEVREAKGVHNGVRNGNATTAQGILGRSGVFDGVDDNVEVADSPDFSFSSDYTVSAWAKPNNTDVTGIVVSNANFTNGWNIQQSSGGSGSWLFSMEIGNAGDSATSDQPPTGNWQHLVGVREANGTIKLYVDGVLQTTTGTKTGVIDGPSPLFIGSYSNGSASNFNGKVDEVAIWNRALTDSEIQELYRRGANRVKYQVRTCSDSNCSTDPEWIGPGGDGTTYFSELYNRVNTDIGMMFSGCYTSNPDICDNTEFSLSGDPLQDPLNILLSDFPAFDEAPLTSRYFQYRVLMEAEDNTACSGSACLPTVSAITFSPTGFYYGGTPEIKSGSSITVPKSPSSIEEAKSGSCTTTYQFSTDGTNYKYWNGSAWAAVSSDNDANSITAVSSQLSSLNSWPSSLYFKAFMASDGTQSCEIDSLIVKYPE